MTILFVISISSRDPLKKEKRKKKKTNHNLKIFTHWELENIVGNK